MYSHPCCAQTWATYRPRSSLLTRTTMGFSLVPSLAIAYLLSRRPTGTGDRLAASPATARRRHVFGGSLNRIPAAASGSAVPFVQSSAHRGRDRQGRLLRRPPWTVRRLAGIPRLTWPNAALAPFPLAHSTPLVPEAAAQLAAYPLVEVAPRTQHLGACELRLVTRQGFSQRCDAIVGR